MPRRPSPNVIGHMDVSFPTSTGITCFGGSTCQTWGLGSRHGHQSNLSQGIAFLQAGVG